jgi:hypothetical protein
MKVSGTDYCIPVDDQVVSEDGINYFPANLHILFNITYLFDIKVKYTLVQALRLCTGHKTHRGVEV